MSGKPDAEIAFSEGLLRKLLNSQHPDLGDLPLTRVGSGWDNEVYRLGDRLAMRMPRRHGAESLAKNEQRWLPILAERLPLAVPTPVRLGKPDATYPWCWSIVPWFDGREADLAPPDASTADTFVEFLTALHAAAPADAPESLIRGVSLRVREDAALQRMDRLRLATDVVSPQLVRLWERGLAASDARQRVWLHGDLHAQNVLTRQGKLHAVIDWGDMTAGDRATDLMSVWSIYAEQTDRERLINMYAPTQAALDRAKGWAAFFVCVLIDSGLHNSPRHERQGRAMLSRLLADS